MTRSNAATRWAIASWSSGGTARGSKKLPLLYSLIWRSAGILALSCAGEDENGELAADLSPSPAVPLSHRMGEGSGVRAVGEWREGRGEGECLFKLICRGATAGCTSLDPRDSRQSPATRMSPELAVWKPALRCFDSSARA